MRGLLVPGTVLVAALLAAAATVQLAAAHPAPAPLYRDPVFDGAHDGEFVWHEEEQCWWITYLQNRFNSPLQDADTSPDKHLFEGTDYGLASTPDNGRTWVYRGVMRGLDLPTDLTGARSTQQYGGATWWRPAVTRHEGVYHGFFVYRPTTTVKGCVEQCIIHYTSSNLLEWKFQSIVGNAQYGQAPGYDSVVRFIAGRWILLSTNLSEAKGKKAWQSNDLYHWEPCTVPGINEVFSYLDEGPHITEWKGSLWLNFDGQDQRKANVARSDDGGYNWKLQEKYMFTESSDRPLDGHCGFDGCDIVGGKLGAAHQGPILPQGERAYALYLVEFTINTTSPDLAGLNGVRSMLQVAEVTYDASTKELLCDRSKPFHWNMEPPPERYSLQRLRHVSTRLPGHSPPVWSIDEAAARTIALAELNRHNPGWYKTELGVSIDWRNPDMNGKFFRGVRVKGSGRDTEYELHIRTQSSAGKYLEYTIHVNAIGEIVRVENEGRPAHKLQYRYDPPLNWAWAG